MRVWQREFKEFIQKLAPTTLFISVTGKLMCMMSIHIIRVCSNHGMEYTENIAYLILICTE
jgi:hypothetical protein